MKNRIFQHSRKLSVLFGLLLFLDAPRRLLCEPPASASYAFTTYCRAVEARLAQQHRSAPGFLAPADPARLHRGDLIIERIPTNLPEPSGALLHHWRGTAFVSGAHAADFDRLIREFNAYPLHFAPQVVSARILTQPTPDHLTASMRVRQHHVITVVMDTTYDVAFGQLDLQHGYSISQSTRTAEIESPGTPTEHALSPAEDHGFLWRLNTYWSYAERDGGLYLQIEAVSLTRAVPRGLGWVIRPYVESIPRESLEFTLRSASDAIRK